jgi:hypothetical protein
MGRAQIPRTSIAWVAYRLADQTWGQHITAELNDRSNITMHARLCCPCYFRKYLVYLISRLAKFFFLLSKKREH